MNKMLSVIGVAVLVGMMLCSVVVYNQDYLNNTFGYVEFLS